VESGRSESDPKQTDAERARTVVGTFVLHLRPVRVPEATIRFTHTFGLGGMSPVGTLLVDLADPKKKELVWRATASHGIDKNASLEGRERIVSGAIAKIFEGFPPGK